MFYLACRNKGPGLMIWGRALNNRDRQPEVMDQPGLDPREHAKALKGLRRINTISRCSAGETPSVAFSARINGELLIDLSGSL